MHKRLMAMKEQLAACVEYQLSHIDEVDCEELGEAIDMLKDLEEALYFCTITEAMNKQGNGNEMEYEYKKNGHSRIENGHDNWSYYGGNYPMMYNDGGNGWSGSGSNGRSSGSNNNSSTPSYPTGNGSRGYYSEPMMYERDEREGRSPQNRRMYMEAKTSKDKATQLRELEKYIQELSNDIMDMIQDASTEEKQYLEKKIATLASKIGQMK